jgi:hypothetical protein
MMLKMSMVNLQSSTPAKTGDGGQIVGNSILARDYNENTILPDYMEHLVGKVAVSQGLKTHVVAGQERRVRGSGIWVINITICDREKARKGYTEPMVSSFMSEYFAIKEPKYDDEDMFFKL